MLLALASYKPHLVSTIGAMCQRNLARCRSSQRRRYAGDHFDGNAMLRQEFDFLAATAEDKWIAALEPDNALAMLTVQQHEVMDLLLLQPAVFGVTTALAHIDQLS